MEIRVANTCEYLLQTLQNRVQNGWIWRSRTRIWVQNGSKMGPIWAAVLDLDPEVSTPTICRRRAVGLGLYGPLAPCGLCCLFDPWPDRPELWIWTPKWVQNRVFDPKMGRKWVKSGVGAEQAVCRHTKHFLSNIASQMGLLRGLKQGYIWASVMALKRAYFRIYTMGWSPNHWIPWDPNPAGSHFWGSGPQNDPNPGFGQFGEFT